MPVLEISRDVGELEKTALALIEWSAKCDAMPEQVKHLLPEPEVSRPHVAWLEYLFRIDQQCGLDPTLRTDVYEGLCAIRRARRTFEKNNKRCRCGRWSPRFAKMCLCGMKFE